MSIAAAIIGLIVIIMIHEAGHFLAARLVGIHVTKFYLFFPPKLVAFRRGEVEYGIGTIPLGGFVKLPGMFEPIPSEVHWRLEAEVEALAAGIASPEARMRVSAALNHVRDARSIETLTVGLTELRTELLASHDAQQHAVGPFVDSSLAVWQRRVRRLAARVESALEDCHPRAYWRARLWRRMTVIAAGPAANVVLAFIILWIVAMALTPVYRYDWTIGNVVRNSPAADAGVRKGDRILAWGGVTAGSTERDAVRFSKSVRTTLGKPVTLKLRSAQGTTRSVKLVPRQIKGESRIGVVSQVRQTFLRYSGEPPAPAFVNAAQDVGRTSRGVVTGLSRLANPDNLDEVSSVVGIVKVAPRWAKAGALVPYLAILSLAIAIYNLLPLLPMDGGHIAFGIIERLRRGRPLPRGAFERYSFVGLALMLGLFFIGLRNDLGFGG